MTVWIGTSWKMNKTGGEALAFARALAAAPSPEGIQRFVVPPFTALRPVADAMSGTDVMVGAQNMHWADDGAWTGEVSAPMLVDAGARMVELGHSERRAYFGETDETVGLKVAAALRHGLVPLICIGETATEKAAGQTDAVLERQVRAALGSVPRDAGVLFAYEPVWAIGEGGSPADPAYVDARLKKIRSLAASMLDRLPACLYGGSVTRDNCADLIALPGLDGLFIGRAAWQVEGFLDILRRCEGNDPCDWP